MADYAAELKRILSAEDCYFVRQGKGSHEIWYSPKLDKRFVVVSKGNYVFKLTGNLNG